MGVRLVGDALRPDWCILSDRARLVLVQMCYVARDHGTPTQPARQYFAGHRALILNVLGKDPDTLSKSNLDTSEKYIQRAIQELRKAGAITLVHAAAPRQNAVYEVHPNNFPGLNQEPLPVDNSQPPPVDNSRPARRNGGHIDPPNGGHIDPPILDEWGTNTSRNGGHIDPPRSVYEESTKRHLEEHHPTQPSAKVSPAALNSLWITR